MKDLYAKIMALPAGKQDLLLSRLEKAANENFKINSTPVSRRENGQSYPMSFSQKRMWFLNQLEPESPLYNMSAAAEIKGKLDLQVTQRALSAIIDRHQILRSYYSISSGEPVQQILPSVPHTLEIIDLAGFDKKEKELKIENLIRTDALAPFDLRNGPLFRFTLIISDAEKYILSITFHHIVSDGWSVKVFLDEFMEYYRAYTSSEDFQYQHPQLQYSDYAAWQLNNYGNDNYKKQLSYWLLKTKDLPGTLELPFSRPRPKVQTFNGRVFRFSIPDDLQKKMLRLGREKNMTVYMTGLAAFQILLYRYTYQENFGVGTLWTNRNRSELEHLIGFFVNTLVIRAELNGNTSVSDVLELVRKNVTTANEYQEFPFEHLVDLLADQRTLSYNPLVQIMFDYQTDTAGTLSLPGMNVRLIETETATSKFDMLFIIRESGQKLECTIEYNTDLYDELSIRRFSEHYLNIMRAVTESPSGKVSDIVYLNESEIADIHTWNSTDKSFESPETLVELFEEQVTKTPDLTAVKFKDQCVSFKMLNSISNQLAIKLRSLGTGREIFTGICAERSIEMLAGIYAILKAGGAFVPIDPNYPSDRISYIVGDAHISVLLTQRKFAVNLSSVSAEIVFIDDYLNSAGCDNLPEKPFKENAAYMIYTSGTTGRPKGAVISHESIMNRLIWMRDKFNFTSGEVVIQKTPYSFDVSLWELFSPLLNGVKLIMAEPGGHLDSGYLIDTVVDEGVTMMHFVPSMLGLILGHKDFSRCTSLKRVFCSGEELTYDLQERFFAMLPDTELIDLFGPTEAAIEVTEWICVKHSPLKKVPIGKPIANTRAYVMDKYLRLLPVGVPGELFLGGIQLSRGYYGMSYLTAEKFIPDPVSNEPGARLYRTGDLARIMEDGNIEFLGRIDFQIKIRGIRVEPAEAEIMIRQLFKVKDAAVLARSTVSGDKQLVAYIVPDDHQPRDPNLLKSMLAEKLPDYLVPSAFVFLESFPVNANGKLDRKALPEPSAAASEDKLFLDAGTPLEKMIIEIWKEVLKTDRISVLDNFFEIGGNSLQAAVMINKLQDRLNRRIHVKHIFLHPSPAELAGSLEEANLIRNEVNSLEAVPAISRTGRIPLSYEQQQLWFLDQMEPMNPFYNISFAAVIKGKLNVQALESGLNEIIRRHEILRSSFTSIGGRPECVIHENLKIFLTVKSTFTLNYNGSQQDLITGILSKEGTKGIDLAVPPLFRIQLFELSFREHLLVMTFHHIIFDGWSVSILFDELRTLYIKNSGMGYEKLPRLSVQYPDFAAWHNQIIAGSENQISYWQRKLQNQPPVLNLPSDYKRPAAKTFRGSRHLFRLPSGLTDSLINFAGREKSTLFIILLSALKVMLYKYSGSRDISIGVPVTTRRRLEFENLIGLFVNSLVLRTVIQPDDNFKTVVRHVSQSANEAYENQDVPLDIIIDRLGVKRDLSYSPLFQIMFDFQDKVIDSSGFAGLTVRPVDVENNSAKFDLLFSFRNSKDGLEGFIEYSTDLFTAETISRMALHYIKAIERLIVSPAVPVGLQSILLPEEENKILGQWNPVFLQEEGSATFVSLFEEQVKKTPGSAAVCYENQRLTYLELNNRSGQLAHYLLRRGVKPETRVGIFLERSVETVIAILAVLKAGAAYVPLDISYPYGRLKAILDESGIPLLVTTSNLSGPFKEERPELILIDLLGDTLSTLAEKIPEVKIFPENTAYIIYTSGSTGKPKGVAVTHKTVLNLFKGLNKTIYSHYPGRFLKASLNAPVSFDASVQQLVLLLAGHCLYILPDEVRGSDIGLAEYISGNSIDVFDCVPSQLKLLLDVWSEKGTLKKPQICLPGGEAIDEQLWRKLTEVRETDFYNMYGPTECTVDSIVCPVSSSPDKPSIGRPLENISVYILDNQLQLQPVGIIGEIFIGEASLARGYASNPALTAQRFLPDPFSRRPGSRMYRSGDLGRFLPDGKIEYHGRTDNQVKIRGFRIELGDIESALKLHPCIQNAAVVVREDIPEQKRITAYIVFTSVSEMMSVSELISYLKQGLPDYMIPHTFIALDDLPFTASGKIDRLKLPVPVPQRPGSSPEYSQAETENEKLLLEIFRQVLGLEEIGIDDNFFELGGDSIISIQAVARARQKGLNITPKNIFQFPTIRELAALTAPMVRNDETHVNEGDEIPLSPIQNWFFMHDFPSPAHWNQSVFIEVNEAAPFILLKQALAAVTRHHESFSFRFRREDGKWKQYYRPSSAAFIIKEFDISDCSGDEAREIIQAETNTLQTAMDLASGPLAVSACFNTKSKTLLFIAVHHLVIDGISWRIFLEDLESAYLQLKSGAQTALPSKSTFYGTWSFLMKEKLPSEVIEESRRYFNAIPSYKLQPLPKDNDKGINTENCTTSEKASLDESETDKLLEKLKEAHGISVQEILLTALTRTIGTWTGSGNLFIDVESHGREDLFSTADISRTTGWFTSIFPVFLQAGSNTPLPDSAAAVHNQLSRIPGYVCDLRYSSGIDNEISDNILRLKGIEISFNYLGRLDQSVKENSLFRKADAYRSTDRDPQAKRLYLLDIACEISNGKLTAWWTYSSSVHRKETILRLCSEFMTELRLLLQTDMSAISNAGLFIGIPDDSIETTQLNDILKELNEDDLE